MLRKSACNASFSNILSCASAGLQLSIPLRLFSLADWQRGKVNRTSWVQSFCPALARAGTDESRLGSEHGRTEGRLRERKTLGPCKSFCQLELHDRAGPGRVGGDAGNVQIETGCLEAELNQAVEALDLLVQQGCHVDTSAIYNVLKSCITQKNLVLGSRVHSLAVKIGYESNTFLANHIIRMYATHGRLKEAMQVFRTVSTPNCYMWASIIFAHARHGQPDEAINLYRQMQVSNVKPNNHIFVASLKACALAEDLCSGREIHADILRTEHELNEFVGSCLVDMYSKCGSLQDARRVFDELPTKDVVTWNAIIAGYAQHGPGQEALNLYTSMQKQGIPADNVTFVCLLQACANVGDVLLGQQLHAQIKERGVAADEVIGSCIVNMYAKCGSFTDACRVFNSLSCRNVLTWTVMIAGYAQHGLGEEALSLYVSMQDEGIHLANNVTFVSLLQACASVGALYQGKQIHAQICERGLETDVVVGACLVDMYAKCESLEDARRVFDSLPTRDVVTWNAMIGGYTQHGLGQEALTLYASMQQEGMSTPNAATFVILLQACGSVAGLEKGKEIHAQIGCEASSDLCLANSLIGMYGKCGSMTDAQQVFDGLNTRDIVTWNALIAGYARQAKCDHVFDLFDKMNVEALKPDGITFLSVLTVCSHVGLVDKGQKYFEAMARDYEITPAIEHYNCMTDLLGRAGQLYRAMELAMTIPSHSRIELWRSVLGACCKWSDVELGRQAFDCATTLDKNDAAAYVLMSNIYASAQMWEEAEKINAMRVKARAWKKPGQSWWTNIDGVVHTFAVGDTGHLERQLIFSELGDLSVKMNEEEPHLVSSIPGRSNYHTTCTELGKTLY